MCLTLLPAPGRAADARSAMKRAASFYRKGHYTSAKKIWLTQAKAGIPAAQYNLAELYAKGI